MRRRSGVDVEKLASLGNCWRVELFRALCHVGGRFVGYRCLP